MSESSVSGYRNLAPAEVQAMRERGEPFRLIDVREPHEYAIAHIEGAELFPLSQAQQWIGSLPKNETLVVFCHSGFRSQQVAQYLVRQLGFPQVANMLGGIDEWSLRVDPSVPRY